MVRSLHGFEAEAFRDARQPFVIVVMPIFGIPSAFRNWYPGPLPVKGVVPSGDGWIEIEATRQQRITAFYERAHNILYPSDRDLAGRRMHLLLEDDDVFQLIPDTQIKAVECLFYDDLLDSDVPKDDSDVNNNSRLPGLLCLHVSLSSSMPDLSLVRTLWKSLRDRQGRSELSSRVGKWLRSMGVPGAVMDTSALPFFTVSFAALKSAKTPRPVQMRGTAFDKWDVAQQWTWLLASLTPPDRFAPQHHSSDTGIDLAMSSTWTARVLRDGASFIGYEESVDGSQDLSFASLALYARTIYLDALLLGIIQRQWLNNLADRIGGTAIHHHREIAVVENIDRAVSQFRASVWWRAAAHGSNGDKLITAFQEQHRLQELLESSAVEISDLVRQARTEVQRKTLESAQKAQRSAERTERRVTLATLIALPSVPILTIWLGVSAKWGGLLIAIGIYVVSVILAFIAFYAITGKKVFGQRFHVRSRNREGNVEPPP